MNVLNSFPRYTVSYAPTSVTRTCGLLVAIATLGMTAPSARADWPFMDWLLGCQNCSPCGGAAHEATPYGDTGCGPKYCGAVYDDPYGVDPCDSCNRWSGCNGAWQGPDMLAPWQLPPGRGFQNVTQVGYVGSCNCTECDASSLDDTNFWDLEQHGSRMYLTGILGASSATLTSTGSPSANEDLFASGGAAGIAFMAFERAWRLEVEGRARDPISSTSLLEDGISTSRTSATGGWSAMINLWRDYDLTESLAGYIGGGVGGGGYRFAVNQDYPIQDATFTGLHTVGGFAWQIGAGIAVALTECITLDLGYRYFEVGGGSVTAQLAQTGIPINTQRVSSAFSANEFYFGIRIYEPVGWRK